jgi:hypothetical protein
MAFLDRLPKSRVPDPRLAPHMRWGVIGTGWIADRFVRALQQNHRTERGRGRRP